MPGAPIARLMEYRRVVKHAWVLLTAAIVLCGAGAYLSGKLLSTHMFKSSGSAWLDAMCESSDGNVSCDAVLASRWGVFPPRPKDVPQEGEEDSAGTTEEAERQTKGMPVGYLGLAYYSFLLVWFAGVGRVDYGRRWWHAVPLGLNVCGVIGSVGFLWVMFVELEVWCPLCVATHVVNFLVVLVNILLWPRRGAEAIPDSPRGDESATAAGVAIVKPHPSLRLIVVVTVLGLMVAAAEFHVAEKQALQHINAKLTASLDEVRSNINSLVSLYQNSQQYEIEVRADDPIRYNGKGLPRLVLWTDFECPHCRRFADAFEQKFYRHFDGFLRLVFKHYPASNECNPHVKGKGHKNACKAARLVEAVRLRGGNAAFWKAHDFLFRNQKRLKDIDVGAVAREVGVEPVLLIADMNSDIITQRIAEDIEQGRKIGVTSTPAIFLSGRRVSPLARDVEGFWKAMGQVYRSVRAKRQHDAAKRRARQTGDADAIPDNLDLPGGR